MHGNVSHDQSVIVVAKKQRNPLQMLKLWCVAVESSMHYGIDETFRNIESFRLFVPAA
jgi:hypothetical protein